MIYIPLYRASCALCKASASWRASSSSWGGRSLVTRPRDAGPVFPAGHSDLCIQLHPGDRMDLLQDLLGVLQALEGVDHGVLRIDQPVR